MEHETKLLRRVTSLIYSFFSHNLILATKPDLNQPGNYFKLFYEQIFTIMTNLPNEITYQAVSMHLDFKTGIIATLQSENEFDICVNEHILNSR